jgi:fermentation-respiration switch protein FrsA (DUF1100 family)
LDVAHKNIWLWLAALLLISAPAMAQTVSELDGDWDGALVAGAGIKLRMSLHIESHGGVTDVTLVSIDEGNAKVPITAITRAGKNVSLDAHAVPGVFTGAISDDGNTIAGTLKPALPLTFTRRAAGAVTPTAMKRPQEPKPPFPYKSEDVSFTGPGGITLAGTLTTPQGAGPFSAVVLVQGSGPHDRDENVLTHKPFLVLADALTRRGIAVMRADKRGVGKSTGDYAIATTEDFADDTQATVAYLRTLKTIDSRKIGLIGHSEGGLIAPMVAVKDPHIAFIVLMAGLGLKGEDILLMQQRLIGQAMGTSPGALDKNAETARKIYKAARAGKDTDDAKARVTAVLLASGTPPEQAAVKAALPASPWFRFFLDYDPVPVLRQVKCSVLAIDGSLDLQVPPKEDLAAIKTALTGTRDVTVAELPGLNHLFQTAKTGAPSEYGEIEETIAPAALVLIGDWVVAHAVTRR